MANTETLPLVEELRPGPEAEEVFTRLAAEPHCVFFDSARRDPELGRYSFVACDPFEYLERPLGATGSFAELSRRCTRYRAESVPGLPPFQGGLAGLFSYDLGRELERLPTPRYDEFSLPALAVGFYDVVVAFDHFERRSWIVSHGFPELDPVARERRARQRLGAMRRRLAAPIPRLPHKSVRPLAREELAPLFATQRLPGLWSNFTREGLLSAIRQGVEFVHAGDLFQVNLSQRLLYPAEESALALYLRLRRRNPATFAGWFDLGDFQILSASPERFLRVQAREIETRPIKGTRLRQPLPEADLYTGDVLRESEKDRAENVMIVDLLRNDLSKVCLPESVRVRQLCRVETYEYVQHLVSSVTGRLASAYSPLDALAAAFPGGSVTGAPKVRAMQIIAELEPTARGAYCGALGYHGFDGTLDSSILIRTVTAGRGWWQFPVGGGIVAQSVPEREYEETWHKAEGIVRALVS